MTEPDFLRATRASYIAVAEGYAERFRDELAAKPLDRAMLAGFARRARPGGQGPARSPTSRTAPGTAVRGGLDAGP